jgi:predicted ATPase/DNA-binding CsgD family transcriptional regulator
MYRNLQQENNTSQVVLDQLTNRYPNNLPAQISSFIGREHETRELISLCAHPDIRLITITGLGGSGKTRLAVEVARSTLPLFTHGGWFMSLASLKAPDFFPEAICSALKIPPSSSSDRKTQLLDYLHEKNILLVLDNFEHLLPQSISLVIEILEHSPSVKILATSRVRLNAPGEQVYRLGGLKYPKTKVDQAIESYGAINLFVEQMRRSGYPVMDSDMPKVARICSLVDGMPLALILAANWGRVMTCSEIVEELERGQQLVALNASAQVAKHNSLRVVFEESWNLLGEEEQVALRRLSVFTDGFERESAAQVARADLDMLAALLDKSMIERRVERGFEMHELLRQFLHEKLVSAGEHDITRDAHLSYFRQLAERIEPELYSHDQLAWWERLDARYRDLHAAFNWGLAGEANPDCLSRYENAVRLAQALWYYWILHWDWKEGHKWYTLCLGLPLIHMPPLVQVRTYAYAAMFESMVGEPDQAAEWAEQALSLAQHYETEDGIALALLRKGGVTRMKDPLQGRALIEQALEMYRRLEQPFYTCAALFYLGQEYHDTPGERDYFTECLDLSLKTGNKRYAANSLFYLGDLACYHGDLLESRLFHEQSYALMKEMNDLSGLLVACKLLGKDHLNLKAFDQAVKLFREFQQVAENSGNRAFLAQSYLNMGQYHRAIGDLRQAADSFNHSLKINQEYRETRITILAYHGLGLVALAEGNVDAAVSYSRKALVLHQRLHVELDLLDLFYWLEVLDSLAASLSASGQLARAAILFSAVTNLLKSAGYQLHPHIQESHDHWLAHARTRLDTHRFAEAWQRGRSLGLDEAIRFSLEVGSETVAADRKKHASQYPSGLTVREVDVLRLVAQGLTDAQVAQALVLSPRTVNAHLTSIYNKLGVSSRSAATRFAVEQGLVS